MSFVDDSKMSLADLPDAADLSTCKDGFYFRTAQDTIWSCELYLRAGKGTVREKATALFTLGHAYARINDIIDDDIPSGMRKAIETWAKAMSLDPTYIEPLISIGNMHGLNGANSEAQSAFDKAVKLNPKDWRIYTGRANAYRFAQKYSDALKAAEQAAALRPDERAVRMVHGLMLERLERYEEAAVEYEGATTGYEEGTPTSLELMVEERPWTALARIYGLLGKPALAAETLGKYIDSLSPGERDFLLYQQRANYLELTGLFGKAAEDLKEAALRAPSEIAAGFNAKRAILLARAGSASEAGDELRSILERGKLNQILRIQVFLKNQGYGELIINGFYDEATKRALDLCLKDKACGPGAGRAI